MHQHNSATAEVTSATPAPRPRASSSAEAVGECDCHAMEGKDFGFSRLPILYGSATQLAVSQPGDPDELEADRVADVVLAGAGPASAQPVSIPPCAACAGAIHRKCAKCKEEDEQERVQRKPTSSAPPMVADIGLPLTGGTALPSGVRSDFEGRFGYDFSRVRVHTGVQAERAASELAARAFTIGTDIAFGAGQFQTDTAAGRRLLAHELTHVIQQSSGAPRMNRLRVQREGTEVPPTGFGLDKKFPRCTAESSREVQYEIEMARLHMNGALAGLADELAKIEAPNPGAGIITKVGGALDRYFKTRKPAEVKFILARLRSISKWLDRGTSNWICMTQQQCDGYCAGKGAAACANSTSPVSLCDEYFKMPSHTARSMVLVHEAAHQAGLLGDVYSHNEKFPDLNSQQAMGNADSYALFVQETALGGLPPMDAPGIGQWNPKMIGATLSMTTPSPGGMATHDGYSTRHLPKNQLKVTNRLAGEFLFHIDVAGFPRPMIFRAPRIRARITLQRTAAAGVAPEVLFALGVSEGIYQGDGFPLGPSFAFDLSFGKADAGILTIEASSTDLDANVERRLTEILPVSP